MFCHKCGKKLPDTAKFCAGCGNKVVPKNPVIKKEEPKQGEAAVKPLAVRADVNHTAQAPKEVAVLGEKSRRGSGKIVLNILIIVLLAVAAVSVYFIFFSTTTVEVDMRNLYNVEFERGEKGYRLELKPQFKSETDVYSGIYSTDPQKASRSGREMSEKLHDYFGDIKFKVVEKGDVRGENLNGQLKEGVEYEIVFLSPEKPMSGISVVLKNMDIMVDGKKK